MLNFQVEGFTFEGDTEELRGATKDGWAGIEILVRREGEIGYEYFISIPGKPGLADGGMFHNIEQAARTAVAIALRKELCRDCGGDASEPWDYSCKDEWGNFTGYQCRSCERKSR